MTDYLLCFPDKDTAIAFGKATGYTFDDGADGVITPTTTKDYCLSVIGEHYSPTENMIPSPFETIPAHTTEVDGQTIEHEGQTFEDIPEITGDGKHWVLFRDLKGTINVPHEASQFIVWSSSQLIQRPPDVPDLKFAGDL